MSKEYAKTSHFNFPVSWWKILRLRLWNKRVRYNRANLLPYKLYTPPSRRTLIEINIDQDFQR
jgi:hypothetical protein